MSKEIITDVEKLSERSQDIDVKKQGKLMQEIILAIKEKMEELDLVSLSAPQIGYPYRIFCVKFGKKNGRLKEETRTLVNPVVDGIKGIVLDREKSVSIPDKEFIIPRNNEVRVVYQNPLGTPTGQKFMGKAAAVIQEMMDYLDGILLSDIGLEIDHRFDEATEEEKNELIDAYMQSLDLKKKDLNEEIESNEELKGIKDAVDFMQSVKEGKTKLGNPLKEKE